MADIVGIRDDLVAEQRDLDGLVAQLDEKGWNTLTPAEPWTVRDQIAHLAFFDDLCVLAITSPDVFSANMGSIAGDFGSFIDGSVQRGRTMSPGEVLAWWRSARSAMLEVSERLEPEQRIPWFKPMSPATFLSARIMETWAHGKDVADGLGVKRLPSNRLRHVAHLGVLTMGHSFVTNGLTPPTQPVLVKLIGPSGDVWKWGDRGGDEVRGSALDFCLVVTRRKNVADTDLVTKGDGASRWLEIAQAFAGPPGDGRPAGQSGSRLGSQNGEP